MEQSKCHYCDGSIPENQNLLFFNPRHVTETAHNLHLLGKALPRNLAWYVVNNLIDLHDKEHTTFVITYKNSYIDVAEQVMRFINEPDEFSNYRRPRHRFEDEVSTEAGRRDLLNVW